MSRKGAGMDAAAIVAGLGGAANIDDLEACITRLRTEVRDPALVDQAALKALGASGVVVQGSVVQVVVGPQADVIADDVHDLLEASEATGT
ncbi:glucose PTS transporter subunit EIIB [Actinomycetospora soli]|uniref:glucose PTS transporter subunit EIIB n=1 Tax=Actinomycetospora soli TaxID=2893887 RepID=UPI0027E37E81|nr:glucose PTS transporter subunit EIIB [Actinomycetospora soli]